MGERETQLERDPGDLGVSVDAIDETQSAGQTASTSRTGRLRSRAASIFSLRAFAITTLVTLVGLVVVGGLLPLGAIANYLGLALGTFLIGLVGSRARYAEAALGGATVAGGAAVLDYVVFSLAGVGLPVVAVGIGSGLLVGLVGHYFGRDLRDGLTRDV